MYIPQTLTEAVRYYSDEQVCIDTVAAMRWTDGKPTYPKCGVAEDRKHYWLASQKRWKCNSCRSSSASRHSALLSPDEIYESIDEALLASFEEDKRIERKPIGIHAREFGEYMSMWANTVPDGSLTIVGMGDDGELIGCHKVVARFRGGPKWRWLGSPSQPYKATQSLGGF